DAAAQLSDSLHLLRCCQLLLGLFQHFLGLMALGDVASDLGKADKLSFIVLNGIDDDQSPKLRSVFANAPTFCFVFTFLRSSPKRHRRDAVLSVLFGVKAAEMLADNFFGSVALDTFGAGIPRRNDTRRIQLENCVINHGLD